MTVGKVPEMLCRVEEGLKLFNNERGLKYCALDLYIAILDMIEASIAALIAEPVCRSPNDPQETDDADR